MQILLRFTLSDDVTEQIMDDGIIISISKKIYVINIVLVLDRLKNWYRPTLTDDSMATVSCFLALRIKSFRFLAFSSPETRSFWSALRDVERGVVLAKRNPPMGTRMISRLSIG